METILVTGASRGIGRSVALALSRPGRRLLLHGRDGRALEETRRGVESAGSTARIIEANLADPVGVEALLRAVGDESIAALVNNAGVVRVAPIERITLADWQESLAVNVTAPFLLSQYFLARMGRGGIIVNISSVAARTGMAGWASYCASKFALEGFSQSLREEARGHGVRVVNVYPTATNTDIWSGIEGQWSRDKMLDPQEIGRAVAYVIERPDDVLVESISLGALAGLL